MLSRLARFTRTMSTTTISSLQRISAKTLSEKILAEQAANESTIAVIDVRDNGKALLSLTSYFHLILISRLFRSSKHVKRFRYSVLN